MGDLNMLAVTGGRERNSSNGPSFLFSAGFELSRISLFRRGVTVPASWKPGQPHDP